MLTIDPSLPAGVSVGDPDEATVTIVDDDGKQTIVNYFVWVITSRPMLRINNGMTNHMCVCACMLVQK